MAVWLLAATSATAAAAASGCADDAVLVGDICVDTYKASVWSTPPGGEPGMQYDLSGPDYPCLRTGQDCRGKIFARSVAGVIPAQDITWFQALAACANVGKRLLTNAEWQLAATGTPDRGANDDHATDCDTNTPLPLVPTGSRSQCRSAYGAYDMVGDVFEWVADWMPRSENQCAGWGTFSDDFMCLTGAATNTFGAGAFLRGGSFFSGAAAGAFGIIGAQPPDIMDDFGFRCAR